MRLRYFYISQVPQVILAGQVSKLGDSKHILIIEKLIRHTKVSNNTKDGKTKNLVMQAIYGT